jgi:ribose transport system ATP-binding protein
MGDELLLEIRGLGKRYEANTVLHDIDMRIGRAEIVGLIGENGAGKSTLQKIIAGVEQADAGSMLMHGQPFAPRNTAHANSLGVGMVFQEQSLIKNLTVSQNIFLGRETRYSRFGLVDWRSMNKDARAVLATIGISDIPVEKKVLDLDFATRQMVEIAKVLDITGGTSGSGSLVLLDEPTSVLGEEDIQRLFSELGRIKAAGNSVIFVSHRLDEVLQISDRIYIFKDGANVGEVSRKEADESLLYEKMVGRSTTGTYFKTERQSIPMDEVVLSVRNLGQLGSFKDISFELRRREVLGICGVVGSGKEALCSVLCGDESADSGEILVKGARRRFNSPKDALRHGIIAVPKERREEGIVGSLSVAENISMSNYDAIKKGGVVSGRLQAAQTRKWVKELGIKCSGINERAEYLSGGNAQKVVFARVISCGATVLILNNPTRGVDVGAKEEIYSLVRQIAERGVAVILLGDTLDECIGLSSKILVMKDGFIQHEFDAPAASKPSQVEIAKYML